MTYRYRTREESVRLALSRKRRLRLIYKWRHGLEHSHQPANRDRFKHEQLAFYEWLKPNTPFEIALRDELTNAMAEHLFSGNKSASGGLAELLA